MARVGFFADQGAKNGSSKGSPYLGEDRLGSYEGKENKPQCHFPLSRQGRHMLTVGREGLCPGNYTFPWSVSSLHPLREGKARGINRRTQHQGKTWKQGRAPKSSAARARSFHSLP